MLWYQLPGDGEIITLKHPGGMYKAVRINYRIMDLLVFHGFLNSRIYLLMPLSCKYICACLATGHASFNQHTYTAKCNQITVSPR